MFRELFPSSARAYRSLLKIGGGLALLMFFVQFWQDEVAWGAALVTVLASAFLVNFPLYVMGVEFPLLNVLAIGLAPLMGFLPTAASIVVGMLLGFTFRTSTWFKDTNDLPDPLPTRRHLGDALTLQLLPLYLAALLSAPIEPLFFSPAPEAAFRVPVVLVGFVFAFFQSLFLIADALLRKVHQRAENWRRELTSLALAELMPIPLVLLVILAYLSLGYSVIAALVSIPAIIAVSLYEMSSARLKLERRLQELSVLGQISHALRSTLNLDELLKVLHAQISQFLNAENFYVALYDRNTNELWYPIAIRFNQPQQWARRPITDRLTDRVITQGKAILLGSRAHQQLNASGLPVNNERMSAWLGVPLTTANETIGCLGVFSVSEQVQFQNADLELLTTIAGQVSVAIANSLLYQQTEDRANQLEILNRIATRLSASLDPQEVLQMVCQSAAKLVEAASSAIYLLEPHNGHLRLAYAHNFSENYLAQEQPFAMLGEQRAQCLHTNQPHLVEQIVNPAPENTLAIRLRAENLQAYGDFPLTIPSGTIGFLSLYFAQPHHFTPEEIELLQTLASQAALAVANARLYFQTDLALSQRAQQLTLLQEISRKLAAAFNADEFFEILLNSATEFTGSQSGHISLYHEDLQQMEIKASRGYIVQKQFWSIQHGLAGKAVRTRQTINCANPAQDPNFDNASQTEIGALLSVPILYEARLLGVITLERDAPRAYSPNEQNFIEQLANQAAVALRNAELYKETQNRLLELFAILNSVEEGIILLDPKRCIRLANQRVQQITGIPLEAILGQQLSQLTPENIAALGGLPQTGPLFAAEPNSETLPQRKTFTLGAGSNERIIERLTTPVWNNDQRLIGLMLVLHDITQEHQIQKARETITDTLIHDLRSPISGVISALDILVDLQEGQPRDELSEQALRVARRSADRVHNLVNSLLDIARMQSGEVQLNLNPVRLAALAADVVGDFAMQANEHNVTLRTNIATDLPTFYADPSKLERVLVNLVDNALKFTPSGGLIELSAQVHPEDNLLQVQISDTGPGIPLEYRTKIFERFNQVPGQRARKRGTGLGLTFCKLAIEAHGGKIWVEANPAGDGSLFCFTLPIKK